MLKPSSLATWGAAVLLLSSLTSCEDILEQYFPKPNPTPPTVPTPPVAYTTYASGGPGNTYTNGMLTFNPSTLTPIRELLITGLSATDRIFGIDLRPATGQLYALVGNIVPSNVPFVRDLAANGRLFTIDPATGAATLVAPLSIPIRGYINFGFDFNPVVDRIRIVSDQGQNLRVNPSDGVAIEDGATKGVNAIVADAAYDNNRAGTATTTLYVIDYNMEKLYRMSSPNEGTMVEIGPLGVKVVPGGFDIGGTSNKAYAVITEQSSIRPQLYSINVATGAATALGDFGFPRAGFVTGFALGAGL